MTSQIANQIGGDQAGRDIVKTYLPMSTGMSRLIREYGDEQGNAPQIAAFIQQLQHFVRVWLYVFKSYFVDKLNSFANKFSNSLPVGSVSKLRNNAVDVVG